MNRPPSIVIFERCYLGALAVGLINTIVSWPIYKLMPAVRQAEAMIGPWYLPATSAAGFLVPLLLWFFAARRASVVAKWIIVILFALGALGVVFGVIMQSYPTSTTAVLSIVAFVLNAIAVTMLFKPDSRLWFGEMPDDDLITRVIDQIILPAATRVPARSSHSTRRTP